MGLTAVPLPVNGVVCTTFFPNEGPIADQWEEYTDDKTKKKYWHKITGKVRGYLRP